MQINGHQSYEVCLFRAAKGKVHPCAKLAKAPRRGCWSSARDHVSGRRGRVEGQTLKKRDWLPHLRRKVSIPPKIEHVNVREWLDTPSA